MLFAIQADRSANGTARFSINGGEWVNWPTAYKMLAQSIVAVPVIESVLHNALAQYDNEES